MRDISLLLKGYQITTVEILYYLPDHPKILQTYVWQEYDRSPEFPELNKFLQFWRRELEGKIHSVKVNVQESLKGPCCHYYSGSWALN